MSSINTPALNDIEDKFHTCSSILAEFTNKVLSKRLIQPSYSLYNSRDDYYIQREITNEIINSFVKNYSINDEDFNSHGSFQQFKRSINFILSLDIKYIYDEIDNRTILEVRQEIEKYDYKVSFKLGRHLKIARNILKHSDQILSTLNADILNEEYNLYRNQYKNANSQMYILISLNAVESLIAFCKAVTQLKQSALIWKSILGEYLSISNDSKNTFQNKDNIHIESNLSWTGSKSDLAELVWAIYKSERIKDSSTGVFITQKLLADTFKVLLGLDSLDVPDLLKARGGTDKTMRDGKTFTTTLKELYDKRIDNSNK